MNLKLKFKRILTVLTISCGITNLSYISPHIKNVNIVEARKIKTQAEKTRKNKQLTTKRWFLNQIIKDEKYRKKIKVDNKQIRLYKAFNNLQKPERANKNHPVMKEVTNLFEEYMERFRNLDEKTILKLFTNDKEYPVQSFNLPKDGSLNKLFKFFWNKFIKYSEKKYIKRIVRKKLSKIEKENNIVFLAPGFGYEEDGAIRGKIKTRNLNPRAMGKLIPKLLKKNLVVIIPFDLKYAGIDLPKHKNLHIIFEERPRIVGTLGKSKIYEAQALIMREAAKYIFNKNKKAKFASITIHYDSEPSKKTVGSKIYYQVDENTPNRTQENSKRLAKLINDKIEGIIKVPKSKGTALNYAFFEEDWAMANLQSLSPKYINLDFAADLVYLAYISNNAELEQILDKEKLEKQTEKLAEAIEEYYKK